MYTSVERDKDDVARLVSTPIYAGTDPSQMWKMEKCEHEFSRDALAETHLEAYPSLRLHMEKCKCGAMRGVTTGPEKELLESIGLTPTPEAKTENDNCLNGLRCPKCKTREPLEIYAECRVVMYDDGSDTASEFEWDENSHINCPHCGHGGKASEFGEKAHAGKRGA